MAIAGIRLRCRPFLIVGQSVFDVGRSGCVVRDRLPGIGHLSGFRGCCVAFYQAFRLVLSVISRCQALPFSYSLW